MPKKGTFKPETIIESRQLTSLSKVLNTLAALLITIIGLRFIAHDLIAPILLALFFTVLIYPVFKWFRHRGFTSNVSFVLMILTFLGTIFLLVNFFTWSFGLINESLETYVPAFKTSFNQIARALNLTSPAETVTQNLSPEAVSAFASSLLNGLSGFVYYFIFVPILSFMILLQIEGLPKDILQKLLKENPGLKRLQKFAQSITLYVIGRAKINLVTGLLFTISLLLIGIDYPIVWGLLTVILGFIPYVGVVIAGIPPVLLALASGRPNQALLVIVALIAVDLFAENLYEPYVQGRSFRISMATVVIALIFWTWLLGFVGAIMAMPLTVLLKTVMADYPETRWLAALMEGNYVAPARTAGKPNRITRFLGKILPRSTKT